MSGDMKHGLTGSRPKLSILPRAGQVYTCRALEYGADKYARGNYHGVPPAGVTEIQRLLGYIDAAQRHLTAVGEAVNRMLGTGESDPQGAAGDRDLDASGGFPASGLPHLAHALASVALGVSCAVDGGLLPADPGQPWKTGAEDGLPQKDDAAAERARVEGMHRRAGPSIEETLFDRGEPAPAAQNPGCIDRGVVPLQPGDCSTYRSPSGLEWKRFRCVSCREFYGVDS